MTFSTYQYQNFAAQFITTTGATTLGTVPASTQWLVKDFNVSNVGGAASNVILNLGGATVINFSVPAFTTLHWTGLRVLSAAATISVTCSVANTCWITVDGQSGV